MRMSDGQNAGNPRSVRMRMRNALNEAWASMKPPLAVFAILVGGSVLASLFLVTILYLIGLINGLAP